MNLTELLDKTASDWPNKMALIEGERAVSYAELVAETSVLSKALDGLNIHPGCRIGLQFPNSVNYVALTFALWRLNVVVVPIPMENTEEEVANIIGTIQLEGILTQKPKSLISGSLLGQTGQAEVLTHNSVDTPTLLRSGVYFVRLTPVIPPDNHGLNLAFIRFTSGTTRESKGVALCHETIHSRIQAANEVLQIGPQDSVMWCLPMSHHFLVTIMLYLCQGATIVLARHILSRPFLEAANRWGGTVLYAAPFHYSMLARDNSGLRLDSVRLAISTTCALPREVATDFRQRFGIPLLQALGIIEIGLVCINIDDPLDRWDSVGRPLPRYRLDIREPDGEGYGDVMITGPGIFDAYTNPWAFREDVMVDGRFATGDIGRIDKDGYLHLAGRKTAVINLAGRKVFPEEIEAVLNRHPSVRESRVFGMAHPHLGEVVEAEVAPRETVQSEVLRDFCRQHLSPDKVPSRFHMVPHVAKTSVTGKIRRGPATPLAA